MTEFLTLLHADEAWAIFMRHFTPVVTPEPCRVVEALDRVLARYRRPKRMAPRPACPPTSTW